MKKALIAAVLTVAALAPSCLGPDHLYNSVKNWNAELSDKDWIDEIVFLGLWFIPVYPFALLGDVVIFNTIDYWSGEDTIKDPGPFPKFTNKD